MKSKLKQFGPLWVWDGGVWDGGEEHRVVVGHVVGRAQAGDEIVEWAAVGPVDEMIKALREAANWLEWRRGCEG